MQTKSDAAAAQDRPFFRNVMSENLAATSKEKTLLKSFWF